MRVALWRYEIRRAGWSALAAPVLVMVLVAALAAVTGAGAAEQHTVVRLLVAGLEVALPLAVGVAAATLAGSDPAIELQLSLPTPYRATLARRFTVIAAWSVLLAAAATAVLQGAGWWPAGHRGAAGVLVWLAPVACLGALGIVLAVGLRSTAAASALLAGVWLGEQLFAGLLLTHPAGRLGYLFPSTWAPQMPGWTTNRVVLLTVAALLLGVTWLLLARPHRLLGGVEA